MAYPMQCFAQVEWGGTILGFAESRRTCIENQAIEYRDGLNPEYSVIEIPGMPNIQYPHLKEKLVLSDNEFFE